MWVPSRAARCQKQGESRRESRELRPHLCNAFNTLYPTTLASRLIINSSTKMHFGVLEKNAAMVRQLPPGETSARTYYGTVPGRYW